jgi:hypothetical protein
MEERRENDDLIRRIMHEEGLLNTSPGFTGRVMILVEEIRLKTGHEYKPLISRKIWIMIALAITMLLLVCFFGVASGNPAPPVYLSQVKTATDFIAGMHVSLHLNAGTLQLATLIMASVGLLVFLDVFLNARFREIHR